MKSVAKPPLSKKYKISEEPRENVRSWKVQSKRSWWLDEFYTKAEEDFHARCKICKKIFLYVRIKLLIVHMNTKHNIIHDYETNMSTVDNRMDYWSGIRFTKDDAHEVECMVCNEILPDVSSVKDSCHAKHTLEQLRPYLWIMKNDNWIFKYLRQHEDFAKCMICEEIVSFYWQTYNLLTHVDYKHKEEYKKKKRKDVALQTEGLDDDLDEDLNYDLNDDLDDPDEPSTSHWQTNNLLTNVDYNHKEEYKKKEQKDVGLQTEGLDDDLDDDLNDDPDEPSTSHAN